MRKRCTNPNHKKYADYGGRGITICERWLSFDNFYADMGDRPPGMSLERKKVDGNYEPGNCRWGTSRDQSRNKRSTVATLDVVKEIVTGFAQGEKQVSLAARFGISVAYIGKIVHGKVWSEIERPYLADWKRPTSAPFGTLSDVAEERASLIAIAKSGSTFTRPAGIAPNKLELGEHRFGLLLVLGRASSDKHGNSRWTVRCSCDRALVKVVLTRNLLGGTTTSCGCVRGNFKHGQSGGTNRRCSGAYVSWQQMIQRCTNPDAHNYADYGGRGISVCKAWLTFKNFYADMGDRPSGMSIERENVNGNYEPNNCRWATPLEQARNTRASVVTLEVARQIISRFQDGETKASIGRHFGVDPFYVGAIINGKSWTELDRPYLQKA